MQVGKVLMIVREQNPAGLDCSSKMNGIRSAGKPDVDWKEDIVTIRLQ